MSRHAASWWLIWKYACGVSICFGLNIWVELGPLTEKNAISLINMVLFALIANECFKRYLESMHVMILKGVGGRKLPHTLYPHCCPFVDLPLYKPL